MNWRDVLASVVGLTSVNGYRSPSEVGGRFGVRREQQRTYRFDPDYVVAPGEILTEWAQECHYNSRGAAAALDLEEGQYRGIVSGTEPITDELAHILAVGTHIPKRLWLNFERNFRDGLVAGKTWIPPEDRP